MAELGRNWERELLADGQLCLTLHQKPIGYKENGIWKRIVNDWEDSGVPAHPHIVTKAPMIVSVADDGMRRIHLTRELDRYIEIGAPHIKIGGGWKQVNLGKPTRTGNLLKWTTGQANLYVRMAGHFIKLGILLKNGWEPPNGQFAFPVGLTGLTRDGGQIKADGVTVMRIGAPHVEDYDNLMDRRSVAWEFVQVNNQWYVLFTLPDLAGMSRPLIDPTLTLQPAAAAGKDAIIIDAYATTNFGASTSFNVGEHSGEVRVDRQLVDFDLSELPDDSAISSITLSLWLRVDGDVTASNNLVFAVLRVKRAWVEGDDSEGSGATWNTYDGSNNWGAAGCSDITDREATDIGVSPTWLTTDSAGDTRDTSLTPTTKAGLDLGYGWLLQSTSENNDLFSFCSFDHATAAQRPKLVIVYRSPPRYGFVMFQGPAIV